MNSSPAGQGSHAPLAGPVKTLQGVALSAYNALGDELADG
jgi:hypothetical protein